MKYKYSFFNDYSEGAHQNILDALRDSNLIPEASYSEDSISQQAIHFIKQHINNPSSEIHFVSGGTQANLVVLSALMKPY